MQSGLTVEGGSGLVGNRIVSVSRATGSVSRSGGEAFREMQEPVLQVVVFEFGTGLGIRTQIPRLTTCTHCSAGAGLTGLLVQHTTVDISRLSL